MKFFGMAAVALLLASATAHPAFAQYPGESKASPSSSDVIGNIRHGFGVWAANEKVREVQQVLRERGHYKGEIDGVLTPEFRRAIWDFQREKGLPRTASLDPATMAALELPATGAASPGPANSFGASEPVQRNAIEAP